MNMVEELVTGIQDQMSQDKTGDTKSTNILPHRLVGNSASECLRSESTAITGRKEKKPTVKRQQCRVGSREEVAFKLRDTEIICSRLLLLSLFNASSIQQGGASEPEVQPGQAGASAKRGRSGGMGKNGGWCMYV